jgi:hypothetical protein
MFIARHPEKMNTRKGLESLDDFGYGSSPMPDRCQQGDDFRLGIDSLQFGNNDFEIPSYATLDFEQSCDTPSRPFFDESAMQTYTQANPQIPPVFDQHHLEKPNLEQQCLTPKQSKRPLVFQPFASFEATEMTVQSLKKGLVSKSPKALPRAHSFGLIGFDL